MRSRCGGLTGSAALDLFLVRRVSGVLGWDGKRGIGHAFLQASWVSRACPPGYADFSRHRGKADFSPPRWRARATEVARPRVPDESGVPGRSRSATWTLSMWPKR